MDYSSLLKNLAKEAGVVVPSNAFKPVNPKLPIRSNTLPTTKVSKCPKCGEPRKTIGWCKPCDTTKLESQFKKWTSGNEYLDSYIRETQINANTPYDFIRWIPYENFTDITFVARGGMGAVYSANSESWGKVALKFLDNSENLTKDFLDELRAYHRCNLGSGIVDCYGVSKDPKTGSYVIVMRYAEHGNLRRYLSNCFTDLTWDEKIVLFDRIGKGLKGIHDNGLVHRDFHSGNILRHEKLVYITDLGMCRPANEDSSSNRYGVLPYVAPEVLRGDPYTPAADIYSLGMIMWEMSSNEPPYSDRAHDYKLAEEICLGLRPPIISGTPKGYVTAMLRCWDCDPSKRPSIAELLNMSYKWRYLSEGNAPFQGPTKGKKVKTGHVKSVLTNANIVHPQAFYTSRLLHFPNLPVPRNSDHYTFFDSTTGEIHMIVRKQSSGSSKKDSSSETPSAFTEEPEEFPSSFIHSDKGKERVLEESRPRVARRHSVARSMTMSTGRVVDKDTIEKIRAERKKLSDYRTSNPMINDHRTSNPMINDLHRQMKLMTIHDSHE